MIYFLDMSPRAEESVRQLTQPWLKSDLLFLRLSLHSGMPLAEVASFLARDERDVRQKAEEVRQAV
jgi:hypothetical protein